MSEILLVVFFFKKFVPVGKIGNNLKLTVIAEGIEEEAQAQKLLAMGCHEGQGYLYAKPMSATSLREWLAVHLATR